MESSMKFFKIITVPDANKLRIPAEFMRRYGHTLPDTVSVQVPDHGPLWNVKLIKYKGETWLENGWENFRDYHSVTMGNFLLFAYNGSSWFDVLIFDTSCTEIQYQVAIVDNEGDLEKPTSGFDSGKVKKETEVLLQLMDDLTESSSVENSRDDTGLKMPKIDKNKSQAYKKAVAFKSDNPGRDAFHISLMQPSYVASRYCLNVPVSFARVSLGCKNRDLIIRDPNGKTWTVKCSVNYYHAKFTSGWKNVVKENDLKVGDVCVFEVMKSAKVTWSMTIFRS